MTEQHLKNDCVNRATIVDVFIKMRASVEMDEKDRGFMIQSIMRPTQDGIVQDDGLPNGQPASILVQLLDSAKKLP